MQFNVGNPSRTAPLPELGALTPKANPLSQNNAPSALSLAADLLSPESPLALETAFEPGPVTLHQGTSLSSVVVFPETRDEPQHEPQEKTSSFLAPSLKTKSTEAARGERLLESLQLRQSTASAGKSYGSLDYAFAKLSREGGSLSTQYMARELSDLMGTLRGLGNADAPPLSSAEMQRVNAALRPFGLMTDGLNLYNLSNRVSAGAGQPRNPAICTPFEVQQMKDVCQALIETDPVGPQSTAEFLTGKSASQNGFHVPDVVFSPSVTAAENLTFRNSRFLPQDELSVLGRRMGEYQDLIVRSEQDIQESEQEISGLISQQETVHQGLKTAVDKAKTLDAQVGKAQQELSDLTQVLALVPGGADTVMLPAQVVTLNTRLKPLGLEAKLAANGQATFLYQGQPVSTKDFKTLIQDSISAKQTKLQHLNLQTFKQREQIVSLERKSQAFSDRIAEVRDTKLKPALLSLDKASDLADKNLSALLTLKADPRRWSLLTQAQQQQLEQLIQQHTQDQAKIQGLKQRGSHQLEIAEQALTKAEQSREMARSMVENLLQLIMQNQQLLDHPLLKALPKTSPAEEKVMALIQEANQLHVDLRMDNDNAPAAMEQSLAWIKETEQLMLEALKHQQQEDSLAQVARVQLDRSLHLLRESLSYHQQQLDKIHRSAD